MNRNSLTTHYTLSDPFSFNKFSSFFVESSVTFAMVLVLSITLTFCVFGVDVDVDIGFGFFSTCSIKAAIRLEEEENYKKKVNGYTYSISDKFKR